MSDNSAIQWCDATWGPTLGCTKVSPGCENCYAMVGAHMRQSNPNPKIAQAFEGLTRKFPDGSVNWTGRLNLLEDRLAIPLRWKKPRRIFVDSQSDLFHEAVPDEFIDQVFAVMASASQHTFQVLTKRPERMRTYMQRVADGSPAAVDQYEERMREHFARYEREFREGHMLPGPPTPELRFIYDSAARSEGRPLMPDGTTRKAGYSGGEYHWRKWPLPNVWLGVSTENQAAADERIPLLLQTPAVVRFISAEPLLGPIDLLGHGWLYADKIGFPGFAGLDWVITGGESGPHHRPFDPQWARDIRDQCVASGVCFFHKQNGGRTSHAGGRLLDGAEWNQMPRVEVAF